MRVLVALPLLLLACKEQGPSPAEIAAARKKTCASFEQSVRGKWRQVLAISREVAALPAATGDSPSPRELKLRALHPSDVTANVDLSDPQRSALAACSAVLDTCDSDTLEETLEACARVDAVVVIRTTTAEKAAVNEAMLNKYTPGHLAGDAFAFALPADGGTRERLGAVVFDTKLRGGVDVEREATPAEREKALNDALRKQQLADIEARLHH